MIASHTPRISTRDDDDVAPQSAAQLVDAAAGQTRRLPLNAAMLCGARRPSTARRRAAPGRYSVQRPAASRRRRQDRLPWCTEFAQRCRRSRSTCGGQRVDRAREDRAREMSRRQMLAVAAELFAAWLTRRWSQRGSMVRVAKLRRSGEGRSSQAVIDRCRAAARRGDLRHARAEIVVLMIAATAAISPASAATSSLRSRSPHGRSPHGRFSPSRARPIVDNSSTSAPSSTRRKSPRTRPQLCSSSSSS